MIVKLTAITMKTLKIHIKDTILGGDHDNNTDRDDAKD